ncbi:type II secretion system F family protein [Thiomicrorhabdus lithotrophica]|uniref:Type II secretion system F family protein n=1 Tax=Thiomicrorhabdus lithotrophica TaxID=2949997 RepID=A0ABY8CEM1_9GAMM|nr:type II secretion system F family protein [Thiomicrorhabdus lithotrophica]WEJ62568.1 type II secretion system F family protein [Thiomicrorhabdus lithotrophica]
MELAVLLLVVAVTVFIFTWLLVSRALLLQAKQIQKERLKSRVGLASQYSSESRRYSKCWWCTIGRIIGPKNSKDIEVTQQQLVSAGFRGENHIGAYFFLKYSVILATALIMMSLWSWYGVRLELVILAPIVVMLLPERVLIYLGNKRQAEINTHLPDFLDMCNICMNAGLSYLVAIKRVSKELKTVHPEVCFEFEYLLDQIQIGVPRTEALRQFAQRNPAKDIQNLVQVLIQNEKLGSSIGEALSEFSRRMYQTREQLLEEKAAKTSAKMAVVIMPFLMMPYLILLVGERMVLLGRGF